MADIKLRIGGDVPEGCDHKHRQHDCDHKSCEHDCTQANVYQNFVFRPGGHAGRNVYNNFEDLESEIRKFQGYKTIQCDDTFESPVVIPAKPGGGDWDFGSFQTELMAHPVKGLTPTRAPTLVTLADGCTFKNLVMIGGYLLLTNLNSLKAPIVVDPDDIAPNTDFLITVGSGPQNNYPQIINVGAAPFIDVSAPGITGLIRMQGTITGPSRAIELGDNEGPLLVVLYDSARLTANMITGTNPAARIFRFDFGSSQIFGQQPNFAGTITNGSPSLVFQQGASPPSRDWIVPGSVNQSPIVALTAATTLGTGALFIFDTTAGNIEQALPKIRNASPTTGSSSQTDGTNYIGGQTLKIKNMTGAGTVQVSPAAGDTIDGSAASVNVTPGRCFTFEADGIDNWLLVAAF